VIFATTGDREQAPLLGSEYAATAPTSQVFIDGHVRMFAVLNLRANVLGRARRVRAEVPVLNTLNWEKVTWIPLVALPGPGVESRRFFAQPRVLGNTAYMLVLFSSNRVPAPDFGGLAGRGALEDQVGGLQAPPRSTAHRSKVDAWLRYLLKGDNPAFFWRKPSWFGQERRKTPEFAIALEGPVLGVGSTGLILDKRDMRLNSKTVLSLI
jgi:hypothetical protein